MMSTQVFRATTTYKLLWEADGSLQRSHWGFALLDGEILGKTPIAYDGADGFSCSGRHNAANRIAPSGMPASHIVYIRS